MRIVMVKGFSKTGKTTTITALIRELTRRGYSVGTIKNIHYAGYRADERGKDTDRHREAGACRVTARGMQDTSIMADWQMSLEEILNCYKEDFVLLEGGSGVKCPVIITGKTPEDVDRKMCPEAIAISGILSGTLQEYRGLPVINGITEVKKLADLIERKTEEKDASLEVELTIGGQEIRMVPFVKETLKNVVTGAVKALDGYEEGQEIIIRIK